MKLGIVCFLQLKSAPLLKRILAKLIELFLISDEDIFFLMIDEGELVVFIVVQLEALFYVLTEGSICPIFELKHNVAMFEVHLDLSIHVLIMIRMIILFFNLKGKDSDKHKYNLYGKEYILT